MITGASTGIGVDAARLFAREGAVLVLGARSEQRLAELTDELTAGGTEATYAAGDISQAKDAQQLIDTAARRYGRLDGAFNNAGISQGGGALADIDEDTFDWVSPSTTRASGWRCEPKSGPCCQPVAARS